MVLSLPVIILLFFSIIVTCLFVTRININDRNHDKKKNINTSSIAVPVFQIGMDLYLLHTQSCVNQAHQHIAVTTIFLLIAAPFLYYTSILYWCIKVSVFPVQNYV